MTNKCTTQNTDPLILEKCICGEVAKANQWYKNNAMKVKVTKHQALILGKTDHNFSFPTKNSLDIFGMNNLITSFPFTNMYPLYVKRLTINLKLCKDSENSSPETLY